MSLPWKRPRTLVASILFLDLVGFSKTTVNEQIEVKRALSGIVRRSLAFVTPDEYRLMDTGDGVAIGFVSDPEHALYAALVVIEACRATDPVVGLRPEHLRVGINLGPVKEIVDVNDRPTLIGDGINSAQRVMSFAQPGQITVSRSFQDSVALIAREYEGIFHDIGAHGDKHGRKHDVYVVVPGAGLLEQIGKRLGSPTDPSAPDSIAPDAGAPPTSAPLYVAKDESLFELAAGQSTRRPSEPPRRWMMPVVGVAAIVLVASGWWAFGTKREDVPATAGIAQPAKTDSAAVAKGGPGAPPSATDKSPDVAAKAPVPALAKSADGATKASAPVTATIAASPPAAAEPKNARVPPSTSSPVTTEPLRAAKAAPVAVPPPAPVKIDDKSDRTTSTTVPVKPRDNVERLPPVATAPTPVVKAAPIETQPARTSAAMRPAADRCGQLLERASLGESLTQDEKTELQKVCR